MDLRPWILVQMKWLIQSRPRDSCSTTYTNANFIRVQEPLPVMPRFAQFVSDLDESTEREMTDKVDKKLLQNATSLKDNSLFMILQFWIARFSGKWQFC